MWRLHRRAEPPAENGFVQHRRKGEWDYANSRTSGMEI